LLHIVAVHSTSSKNKLFISFFLYGLLEKFADFDEFIGATSAFATKNIMRILINILA